jgi:hypothetical protein
MEESNNERLVRMRIFSRYQEWNHLFVKNYLQRSNQKYLISIIDLFKKIHRDFAQERIDDLICELGHDQYLKTNKNIKPLGLLNFCKYCGAAIINQIEIKVKPHICWYKVNLEKFQFKNECVALLLDNQSITVEDAKFLIWSLNENGSYKIEM